MSVLGDCNYQDPIGPLGSGFRVKSHAFKVTRQMSPDKSQGTDLSGRWIAAGLSPTGPEHLGSIKQHISAAIRLSGLRSDPITHPFS